MKKQKTLIGFYKKSVVSAISLGLFLGACSYKGNHQPVEIPSASEEDTKTTSADGNNVLFADVQPILGQHCMSCHQGLSGKYKINWMKYSETKSKADDGSLKKRVVVQKSMPPAGDSKISQAERDLIAQWIADGALEKNVATSTTPNGTAECGDSAKPDSTLTAEQKKLLGLAKSIGLPELEKVGLIQSCTGCHGTHGVSSTSGTPHLLGQTPKYITDQLVSFKGEDKDQDGQPDQHQRPDTIMQNFAANLSAKDIETLADYFGRRSYKASDIPLTAEDQLTPEEKEKLEKGEARFGEIAAMCVGCHNGQGVGPRIYGQDAAYLAKQLRDFKSGDRKSASMEAMIAAANLSDEDMENISFYLSRQTDR